MWFAPLLALLGQLPGVLGQFFQKQSDVAMANLDLQKEIVKAQILQAAEAAKAQLDYQTAALNATTPIFKQRIFWFLSIPILLSICYPPMADTMWKNLSLVPDAYWSLYSAVVLTIWGIPVASNMVSNVFNGFSSYASNKRADKIELQKVSSEQYKAALADAMRHVSPNGQITQLEWDKVSAALDRMGSVPERGR